MSQLWAGAGPILLIFECYNASSSPLRSAARAGCGLNRGKLVVLSNPTQL